MTPIADLLPRARAGDETARAEFLERVHPRVTALVHRQIQARLRPAQHALLQQMSTGDVVQDVLVEVVQRLDQWECDDDAALLALLATLVEHRLIDRVRHSQADRRDVRRRAGASAETAGVAAPVRGPRTLAEITEQVDAYREVLLGFSDREQALLALRLERQLEFDELARRLAYPSGDATRKAFHTLQARLLLRLRARGVGGTATGGQP